MKARDFVGVKFGALTAVKELERHMFPNGKLARRFLCVCDCGTEAVKMLWNLASGNTTSCGCRRIEVTKQRSIKHGMTGTPEYRTWRHVINRCYNTKVERYKNYGGRGISVCEEWREPHGFDAFFAFVGPRPGPEYSIDRIDVDGNYEPGNVKWSTRNEQMQNRQNAVRVDGVPLAEFCRDHGLNYLSAWHFLKSGKNADEIIALAKKGTLRPLPDQQSTSPSPSSA